MKAYILGATFLFRTGSFLLFEWLMFIFYHITHSRVANFTAALLFKHIPLWLTYGFVTFDQKVLRNCCFFWDWKFSFQNHFFLIPAPDVIHIFSIFILVSKSFPCGELLRYSSLIHNLALPHLKPRTVYRSNMTVLKCIFLIHNFYLFLKIFPLPGAVAAENLVFLL